MPHFCEYLLHIPWLFHGNYYLFSFIFFESLIYKTDGVSCMPQFPGSFNLIFLGWGWNTVKYFDLLFQVLLSFLQYCNIILDTWMFLRLYISLMSIQEIVQFVFILVAIKTSMAEFIPLLQIESAVTQRISYESYFKMKINK